MVTRYLYQTTIRNDILGASKTIRAMTRAELDWLVQAQLSKWAEQTERKRQQRDKEAQRVAAKQEAESLRLQAEADSVAAQQRLDAFRRILRDCLSCNLRVRWEELLSRQVYPPFKFDIEKPNRDELRLQLLGPPPSERVVPVPASEEPSAFEILPFIRKRRIEREEAAQADYEWEKKKAHSEFVKKKNEYLSREKEVLQAFNNAAREYNARLQAAKQQYRQARDEFISQQEAHNEAVLAFRSRLEQGAADAVEHHAEMILYKATYPEGIGCDIDVQFEDTNSTLIINRWLPAPEEIPKVIEYKYVVARKSIKEVEMKPKDFEAMYDDILHQIALRTVHEVFVADYTQRLEAIVFNGWIHGTNGKTGKPFTACILSYEVSRKQFAELDLAQVSPKECIRGLKGVTAGSLAMLAPVKPIMEINRDDERFVQSKEVMATLSSQDNLCAMEWEDFEHLVRELFEKQFSQSGCEVRVTQASRDRGVDAIAFDPDPIRGGKFVIQAKRYNMVVPVSAVRDLYGTMIAEGAVKGILVTTSHFGRDSIEFANGKPITLINGENLVHMFQEHGRNVHIALLPKGDPRRGI
jgi:restriction system protein